MTAGKSHISLLYSYMYIQQCMVVRSAVTGSDSSRLLMCQHTKASCCW